MVARRAENGAASAGIGWTNGFMLQRPRRFITKMEQCQYRKIPIETLMAVVSRDRENGLQGRSTVSNSLGQHSIAR